MNIIYNSFVPAFVNGHDGKAQQNDNFRIRFPDSVTAWLSDHFLFFPPPTSCQYVKHDGNAAIMQLVFFFFLKEK